MKTLRFLIVNLCCLAYSVVLAQIVTPEEDLDYDITEVTLPGGRLGNNVNAIVEGPFGFLWFGSHGGLHRYDGYEFITYKNMPGDTVEPTRSLTFPYIENLYWDSHNILWVTTYGGGLFRFDPSTEQFKHYKFDPENEQSISHPRVMCAGEDSHSDLWFGTSRGLNKFDRENETFIRYYPFDPDPESPHNDIRNLYVDKSGKFWIAAGESFFSSNTGGLASYDDHADSFRIYEYPKREAFSGDWVATRALLEDGSGNFWVGNSFGLEKLDRKSGIFTKMVYADNQPHAPGEGQRSDPAVFDVLEDHNGGLWISTIGNPSYPSHLLRYDPQTSEIDHFPLTTSAWDIHESSDGTMWVAGASMSGRVFKITPKPTSYDLQRRGFYEEAFEKTNLHANLYRNEADVLASGSGPINMTIDPSSGHIWGTHVFWQTIGASLVNSHAILSRFQPNTDEITFYHLPQVKLNSSTSFRRAWGVGKIAVGKDGKLWASFPSDSVGVISFDPYTESLQQFVHDPTDSNSISSNYIVDLHVDALNNLWIATAEEGLNQLITETGKINRYNYNSPWNPGLNNFPIAIEGDETGTIWVGGHLWRTDTTLLLKINPQTASIEEIPFVPPKSSPIIDIAATGDGKYLGFILYEFGIGILNIETKEIQFLNSQSGFEFDYVMSILADEDNFWIGDRDRGTFIRLSPSGERFLFQNSVLVGSWSRRALKGPDGRLYFQNGEGWAEINPKQIQVIEDRDTGSLQIVDLYVLGEKQIPGPRELLNKPIWMVDQLRLPYDAETFAFRFSDFNNRNSRPAYRYRLYPYESIWRNTDIAPVANYYKVPTGSYRFQVQSATQNSNLSYQEIDLPVNIMPPWWATWWAYALYAGIVAFLGWRLHLFQKSRVIRAERERTREKELEQAREVEKAYKELGVAHENLKATQSQLVHAEKMASLGELTAGIAHEIQNPLNFVNNFSEVSTELLDDIEEEFSKGDHQAAVELGKNLRQNLEKITHHGERASAIVKSMLLHSRADSGKREMVDINALADEYLRLAYHGMRAKDKSFNVSMKTDFDTSLGKIEMVPQEIGRVLLNLITNAFYAVADKKKKSDNGYSPEVLVSTKSKKNLVEISVKDNGNGVPQDLVDKIFQPFFTTKPTGEGTGLGLSLSYDILKAHGGDIKIKTENGEGTEMSVLLPYDNNDCKD
ncbi:MAG: ATP-binding protein [Saprospiraceae bacterium]|nr:ATP-binding protein [Saprospiraceae bacterium]